MSNIVRPDFRNNPKKDTKEADKAVPGYQLLLEIGFSSPPIRRRIQMSGKATLGDLHEVIKSCFGWSDEHSHRFFIGKVFYGPQTESNKDSAFDEAVVKLHQLEESMGFVFTYIYDAGSGWECEISLEEKLPPKVAVEPPVFLEAEQANPPDQFYDIHEYQSFLADLEHAPGKKRRTMLADYNLADNFNPVYCDEELIVSEIQQLTKD